MASAIVIPTVAQVGGFSTEVADAAVAKGSYDSRLATYVVDGLTVAASEITALQAGTVSGIIPAASVVQQVRQCRGAVFNNVASLASFTVTGNAYDDGLTYAAGDIALLVNQTTGSQDGPYVVGTVASTTAPLTRPTWWAAASVQPGGCIFVTNEGTEFRRKLWMATLAGPITVGTSSPAFYPNNYRKTITLAAGTYKIGFGSTATPDEALFLLSTTESIVTFDRDTAGGTLTGTVMYACPVATRTAGTPGAGFVVINSVIEAGTLQNQDTSTIGVTITNW